MPRAKTFSADEIKVILETMREGGVAAFSYRGLQVTFDPHFRPLVTNPSEEFIEVQDDPQQATKRVKRAQIEAEEDLFWSA